MRPSLQRQRGVAVITAILIVAIGTSIAVSLLWESTLDQRRTESAVMGDQGLLWVQGAEAWAADILRQDLVDSPDADSFADIWAIELAPLPVEGGTIAGSLEDLQGRFNINNLLNVDGTENELAVAQFQRLLASLDIDPSIAGRTVDWLDADTEPRFPDGGEDVAYSGETIPYRTANVIVTSTSELMAVSGMDKESYAVLEPYVAALPQGTTLNVNTASNYVLASLSDDIDLSTAESLIFERADAQFVDIEASFGGLIEDDVFSTIDAVSTHFLLTATVTLGNSQTTIRSVLQRDPSGITRAIFRNLGVH
ncbi:MAG: type II secretion system minor pseudopilin GspK [Gammaproteobacteria bacterium]|jgi:general secretion pathway protein K